MRARRAARFGAVFAVIATSLAATSFAVTAAVARGGSSGGGSSGGGSSGGGSGKGGGGGVSGSGHHNPAPAITSFAAAPSSVTAGQSSTLSWGSTNATSCVLSGALKGNESASGSLSTGALSATSSYTLTCSGSGGTASASVTVTVTPVSTGTGAACQSVAIPAYFYPSAGSSPWTTAAAAEPGVGIMVANVDSGPGTSADPNYATAIAQARAAGSAVYGYVYTNYGANSLASVEANISLWKSLYGVTNIFIDEASINTSTLQYYEALSSYVHQTPGALTILNFGTMPPESFMSAGDIMLTFEGSYSTYESTTFPSWVTGYAADRFYNIVYDVPNQTSMTQVLGQAENYNVGYIYVTNETLPNPYDSVPPYLSSEASEAHSNCSL